MEVNQVEGTAANDAVSAPAPESQPTQQEQAQAVDLDGLSEFTYQGEKYNPDQLHKIFSEHKTWAESQKQYQEEKKFLDNLDADLENVLQDPRLADRFKQVYPKRFHTILDKLLRDGAKQETPAAQPNANPSLPKEFLNEFGQVKERLKFFEDRAYQAEVQAAEARLESLLPPMFEKYPLANEDQVYTRAERLLSQGQKLSEKTWERLVRESHEGIQKKADKHYGEQLKNQIDKGRRGADTGAGGATPGQAPKPRTFEEAQEAMLKHYSGR